MGEPFRIAAFIAHLHGAAVLETLLALSALLRVVLVVTDDPRSAVCNPARRLWHYGFDDDLRLLVPRKAAEAGIPVHTGTIKGDAFSRLFMGCAPDAIVTMVFGQRLPGRLLDQVARRAWNVHPVVPGLPLAATRGPAGFEEALRLGAGEVQMCLHQMTEVIDDGMEVSRSAPMVLPRVREFTAELYLAFQQLTAPLSAGLVREALPALLSHKREMLRHAPPQAAVLPA